MGKFNKGGLIGGFDQLRAPNAPTLGDISVGSEQLSVAITVPTYTTGTITSYCATAIAGGESIGAESSSSPVTITGLTNGTEYTVSAVVKSKYGSSPPSTTSTATPATLNYGARGIFVGGYNSSGVPLNVIDYINISSTGNATDFGDMNVLTKGVNGGLAGGSRGVIGGIHGGDGVGIIDNISFITTSSTGNASDFGDLTQARDQLASFSSGSRGCFAGGQG